MALLWSFLFTQKKQFLRLKLKLYLYRLGRHRVARSCVGVGPIKIGLRPVTVALGAAPLGLLERRTRPAAPLAVLDDLAVAMHLPDAAALAAGRPL